MLALLPPYRPIRSSISFARAAASSTFGRLMASLGTEDDDPWLENSVGTKPMSLWKPALYPIGLYSRRSTMSNASASRASLSLRSKGGFLPQHRPNQLAANHLIPSSSLLCHFRPVFAFPSKKVCRAQARVSGSRVLTLRTSGSASYRAQQPMVDSP